MIRKIEKKLKVDLDEAVNLYNQAFEEDSKLDEAIAKSKQLYANLWVRRKNGKALYPKKVM